MIALLTSTLFGWILTLAVLAACFACTLMVELSWTTRSRRRLFIVLTWAAVAVWFVIVMARFAGSG
ncbi:MAG: hypothetical protein WCI74_05630 [Actinomycetes bacterium]